MAHWAELDDNNIVTRVVVCSNDDPDEGESWLYANLGGNWVKTSYNSFEGQRIDPDTGETTSDHFRFNFAGEGYTYDPNYGVNGAFIPPKPFPSWVLAQEKASWEPPTPAPETGGPWLWDENTLSWFSP